MKSLYRILALLLCAVLVLGTAALADDTMENAIAHLKNYANAAEVQAAQDGFAACPDDTPLLSMYKRYANAIMDIHLGDYESSANLFSALTGVGSSFHDSLSEHGLPACADLGFYAQGRALEAAGDTAGAQSLYALAPDIHFDQAQDPTVETPADTPTNAGVGFITGDDAGQSGPSEADEFAVGAQNGPSEADEFAASGAQNGPSEADEFAADAGQGSLFVAGDGSAPSEADEFSSGATAPSAPGAGSGLSEADEFGPSATAAIPAPAATEATAAEPTSLPTIVPTAMPTATPAPAATSVPTEEPVSVMSLFRQGDTLGAANHCIRTFGMESGSTYNNLAFLVRYGHLMMHDLDKSLGEFTIPDLLESGVSQNYCYAVLNMALYDMEIGSYLNAYELILQISDENWNQMAGGFWKQDLWDPWQDPEGALVCLLAQKYGSYQPTDEAAMAQAARGKYPEIYSRFIEHTPSELTLKRGDNNEDVAALQIMLIEHNYLSDVADGSFGPKTETAVKAVQTEAGLSATGVTDAATLDYLATHSAAYAPEGTNGLSAYYLDYDPSFGYLTLCVKNTGSSTIKSFGINLRQCTSGHSKLGTFFGDRNDSSNDWYTTVTYTGNIVSGATYYLVYNLREGDSHTFTNGQSYDIQYFQDSISARVDVISYTTTDDSTHDVDKTMYVDVK